MRTSLRAFTTELTFLGFFFVHSRPNYGRAERLAGHCAFQGENFEAGNMARYGSGVISGGDVWHRYIHSNSNTDQISDIWLRELNSIVGQF